MACERLVPDASRLPSGAPSPPTCGQRAGTQPRQLTQFHSDTLFSFDWSHDGKKLVFNRGVEARDVVLVQDAQRK